MQKSKIEWCDYTWNPITGCLHGCTYCYARDIANRFKRKGDEHCHDCTQPEDKRLHEKRYKGGGAAFRYNFEPTLNSYRLSEPVNKKKLANIFVCSMADLFGDWVPDEWIKKVFDACEKAPQHNYIFLTKNPERYGDLYTKKMLPYKDNYWFGSTITKPDITYWHFNDTPYHSFVCIEPLIERLSDIDARYVPEWVIVGAMTGVGSKERQPKSEWIEDIRKYCEDNDIPYFEKNSLQGIVNRRLIQEFPHELMGEALYK